MQQRQFAFESVHAQSAVSSEVSSGSGPGPDNSVLMDIPPSPLDNTYAYAESGVGIQLFFTYTDLDPNYAITLKFRAGEYLYRCLWDFGPDEVKKISLRLVDVQTGETQDTPYYDIYGGFHGEGWARHANAHTPDKWFALWKRYKITRLTVLGSEGRMFIGPTNPMWTGREEETFQWG
ncbi:hypothetical protein [Verminephrobacter aporrectodeae]|uniref:hypothetical protein n=1 Tax=Verminephrobacter aporrectodeae TaxID=1110389 RepID=UPI002237A57C|nr:hypothetical protein [Verminephrobacter aporrectodeae]